MDTLGFVGRATLLMLLGMGACLAEVPKGIQFRADYYKRELSTNRLIGRGNAWVKGENREIWADEIEVDLNTDEATAKGNVKMQERDALIWASLAHFHLKAHDARFEKATIVSGQVVVTGEKIQRLDQVTFEIEEGSYTNCNVDSIESRNVGTCPLDWRISGRRFRLSFGGYAHFYDVLIAAKDIPLFYAPYIMLPVKTERQSGLLMPSFPTSATLGTGVSFPLFLALSSWQDLLLTYTHYSSTGEHLGIGYRYIYSPQRTGYANLYFVSRRFSDIANPAPDNQSAGRFLGLFGEGAVRAHNLFHFNDRVHSRQMISWVSDPYYTFDYGDAGPRAEIGNLRSQLTFTYPGDEWLFTGQAQYLQSVIVSKDSGVDEGGVAQLPILTAAKTTTPLWRQILSYEVDAQFTNFGRATAFDQVPLAPVNVGPNTDADSTFDSNDFLRTGRRLQLEPRLVTSIPMPAGFQFQPLVRAGSLLYHFDLPTSSVVHREYVDIEIPIAMQVSRVFHTSIAGYEKISHVLQPRFIYAASLLQTGGNDHAFFLTDPSPGLSNPRFDIIDQITPYEYMRFELINRFQRKTATGAERFFWFQVSEQYNLRTSTTDPRYRTSVGPIEVFSSLAMGSLSLQLQSSVALEPTTTLNGVALATPVYEAYFSTGMSYRGTGRDKISLNGLYRNSADRDRLQALTANIYIFKELPTFFDLEGYVEYNFLTHELYAYRVGFHFRAKPKSCWSFSLTTGRNNYRNHFTNFAFALNLGDM